MNKISVSRFAFSLSIATLLAGAIPGHAQGDGPKTPLMQEMGGIAKDFRALRKAVADPTQKAEAVALVKDMEDHATKAKGFEPQKTKDIAPADKDQFIADYKKQIDGLIADMQKVADAVSAGDTAGATKLLDALQMDKREGHKKFIRPMDGGQRPPPPFPPAAAPAGSP